MTEIASIASAAGTAPYSVAAHHDAGTVVLAVIALCVSGAIIGMLWKWRRKTGGNDA